MHALEGVEMQTAVTIIAAVIKPFRRRFMCQCGYKTNNQQHFSNHIDSHRGELIDLVVA